MGAVTGQRRGVWRSRWAAFGAAVAVTLGGGGLFVANAASGPTSAVVTVTPERVEVQVPPEVAHDRVPGGLYVRSHGKTT
ncbi:MAG TPA: hypothetical protein VES40_15490 [Ilumatobacteraceae bacterium]|nr:hypothetical protein [Ilumatobacteraceae bacterium]